MGDGRTENGIHDLIRAFEGSRKVFDEGNVQVLELGCKALRKGQRSVEREPRSMRKPGKPKST